MTEADDRQDGIERAPADDEAGLWADVRSWTDAILAVVGDLKELATVGLTRSLAVKLCNWLWGMEGAIRRLILAEALKLDASTLAGSRPGTRADASEARRPARRRPSFRIFGFSRQGEAGTGQLSAEDGAAKANLPERWHIRFPADPLLSIGGRSIRGGKAASAVRRINPLDRRGRISRFDPDYGEDIDEAEYQRRLLGLSPSRADKAFAPAIEPAAGSGEGRLSALRPVRLAPAGGGMEADHSRAAPGGPHLRRGPHPGAPRQRH